MKKLLTLLLALAMLLSMAAVAEAARHLCGIRRHGGR